MEKKLQIYNTATRRKEPFTAVRDEVGMYCCGPTVYNYAHIGNLRTYVFEDVLKRTLLAMDYRVKHVTNITDVGHLVSDADTGEDKMEKGARSEGKSVWEIARFYTGRFMENIGELNILQPDAWPKATDHIGEMIAMVRQLQERGFTYRTGDGIYFDTSRFPAYGDFARLDAESLRAGSRVDMGDKRAATDFALWKFSPADVKRQMEWESPWGRGFPGWHIECSAMSLKYLAQPIDIHCGGSDHIRVHHTNEIAQVEAATGKRFARYWVHGEFLVVDKGKMAKSEGNFVSLDTLKERGIPPLAYRMFCCTAHYRSPLSFSWEGLAGAAQSLANLKKLAADASAKVDAGAVSASRVDEMLGEFSESILDDLNVPRAMGALWEVLHSASLNGAEKVAAVRQADAVLGLDLLVPDVREVMRDVQGGDGAVTRVIAAGELPEDVVGEIAGRAEKRRRARKDRDFAMADTIRGELQERGVEIKDLPGSVTECRMRK